MPLTFDHSYARDLPGTYLRDTPAVAAAPRLLVLNEALARDLGLDVAELSANAAAWFSGAEVPPGADPIALAYAGHQFGGFSPQLGDGRAHLLGEIVTPKGRYDLQLKGSGRTPFSRGGDGRAAVGPMLREYLISEAMAALGVPTTRSLAVVATGEDILRDTTTLPGGKLPGAVVARIAASHIRVGTFQFFSARDDLPRLKALTAYTIQRHYPHLAPDDALGLFDAVTACQTRLIAQWMGLGFIHGVMNTDNMALSGETIDYGPCAFMEAYAPATVFSSIDRHGRYAYANQPLILAWNLARLIEALLPLIDPDQTRAVEIANQRLDAIAPAYRLAWADVMRQKLGLSRGLPVSAPPAGGVLGAATPQNGASTNAPPPDNAPGSRASDNAAPTNLTPDDVARKMSTHDDGALADAFLDAITGADFTLCFRRLADAAKGRESGLLALLPDPAKMIEWLPHWRARLAPDAASLIRAANPAVIPRNHMVEQALTAATKGDLTVFNALLTAVQSPFAPEYGREAFTLSAPSSFGPYVTFCGT